MIEIEYKGGNSVVVSTKNSKLVFDPNRNPLGLNSVATRNAVEVATEARFAVANGDEILAIESPGAYEIGDFSINGIAAQRHIDSEGKKSTIYSFEVEEVKIVIIGNIDPKLTEEQLEDIGVVDIAIIPVGGNGYTLDATSASKIARQLDAKIVIPVHYADSSLNYEVPQDEVDIFVKELGRDVEKVGDKYKIKNLSSLPESPVTVIIDKTN